MALIVALMPMRYADAQLLDVYGTRSMTGASPAAPVLRNASCEPTIENRPVDLDDVMLQAVCASPLARQAWANARAQAAQVGVEEAAYLPRLDATTGVERDNLSTTYAEPGYGGVTQSQNSTSRYLMLQLNWLLFDFGRRSASVRHARDLLEAANAAEASALQTVLFNAAQAYYDLRDAQATADAARASEAAARESLDEARARHDAGAGTLSDQLQAQTSYRRMVLDRVSADGAIESARGALAVAMGLRADAPLQLAPEASRVAPDDVVREVSRAMDVAMDRNPQLLEARAKLDAARANVDVVRAQNRPSVSLTGSLALNNPSYQQQPSQIPVKSSRGNTIGIQVSIPLFDGFSSGYQIAAAQEQANAAEADLHGSELQVSLDVWKGFHDLQADTSNLDNTEQLLADARQSLDVARGRYRAGVGTMTELLAAQSALADARKLQALAVSKWHTGRLKLATSLGELSVDAAR
ncbi:channel protein TolC [Burkholderia sp. MSh2]|nr:channel protein TolC [Burkholderia sp. MSh2]